MLLASFGMLDVIMVFLNSLPVGFRSRAALQAEIIALRVHGEFLLTPPSVFDRAPDNVAANDRI